MITLVRLICSPKISMTRERAHKRAMPIVGYQRNLCVFPKNGSAVYPRYVMYEYHAEATAYKELERMQLMKERPNSRGSKRYWSTYVTRKLQKKAFA